MLTVFVYPEKTRETLGAERWRVEWEQIKPSIQRSHRMIETIAANKHARAGHTGEFLNCEDEQCLTQRYRLDFDPDSHLDTYHKDFRGNDAEQRAKAFAQKEVNKGKTAFGSIVVYKQVVDWYVEEDQIAEWVAASEREEFTVEPKAVN